MRRQEEERDANGTNGGDSSRGSTPTPVPPGADRVTSPPIPAIRNSQGGGNSSNNSEFESGSMGLSSDDDQVQNQYLLTINVLFLLQFNIFSEGHKIFKKSFPFWILQIRISVEF